MLKIILMLVAILVWSIESISASYNYTDDIVVKLGTGFDSSNPSNDVSTSGCFKVVTQEQLERSDRKKYRSIINDVKTFESTETSNSRISIEIKQVNNQRELYESLQYDINLSAKVGAFKGSASNSYKKEHRVDEATLTYVIGGSKTFPSDYVNGIVVLTEVGKSVLKQSKRPYEFYKVCGSEVVTAVTRGASLHVIYNFYTNHVNEKRSLKSHVDAKFKGYSGNANFQEDIKSVSKYIDYNFSAEVSGSPIKTGKLFNVINENSNDLKKIKEHIVNVAKSIDKPNANTFKFNTVKVTSIPAVSRKFRKFDFSRSSVINSRVIALHSLWLKSAGQLEKLGMLLDSISLRAGDFHEGARSALMTDYNRYFNLSEKLLSATSDCAISILPEKCVFPITFVDNINPDNYIDSIFDFRGWESREGIKLYESDYWRRGISKLSLLLDIRFPKFISEVEVYIDDKSQRIFRGAELQNIMADGGKFENVFEHISSEKIWCYADRPTDMDTDCNISGLHKLAKSELSVILNSEQHVKPVIIIRTITGREIYVEAAKSI